MAMVIIFKSELVAAANAGASIKIDGVTAIDLSDMALLKSDFPAWVKKTQTEIKNPNVSVSIHSHEFVDQGAVKTGILINVDDRKVVQVLNLVRDYGPEYGQLLTAALGLAKSLTGIVKLYKGMLTRFNKDLEKILK